MFKRSVLAIALVATLVASTVPADTHPEHEMQWLAGDWHVHTSASHDACDPRNATGFLTEQDIEEGCGDGPHTISSPGRVRMLEAQSRNLDYVRLTDHNTLHGQKDALDGYAGPVTLVPGYEHSLDGGHAGISTLNLLERGRFDTPPGTAAGFNDLISDVHAESGGLFVVNHPTDGDGEGWFRDGFDWASVDALEIWNIHWLWRDDVDQDLVGTSNNDEALDLWTSLLDDGHRIAALGASDNHWLATSAVQGIGQPTTWVLAEANTPAAIIDAVHEGRTYVTWDPVGPRVAFTGTSASTGTVQVGDQLPTGEPVTLDATVTAGAGERIRFVSCRGIEAETAPGVPIASLTTTFEADCWVRLDLLHVDDEAGPDHLLYRAITSPIYVSG